MQSFVAADEIATSRKSPLFPKKSTNPLKISKVEILLRSYSPLVKFTLNNWKWVVSVSKIHRYCALPILVCVSYVLVLGSAPLSKHVCGTAGGRPRCTQPSGLEAVVEVASGRVEGHGAPARKTMQLCLQIVGSMIEAFNLLLPNTH